VAVRSRRSSPTLESTVQAVLTKAGRTTTPCQVELRRQYQGRHLRRVNTPSPRWRPNGNRRHEQSASSRTSSQRPAQSSIPAGRAYNIRHIVTGNFIVDLPFGRRESVVNTAA